MSMEKELLSRLQKIFGFKKATFSMPSESFEQDTLFVFIENAFSRVTDKITYYKVNGSITIFTQDEKMPTGFMNKRIEMSDIELTKDLFFFNIDTYVENSQARVQNINERRASFVFMYKEQFNPEKGQLTELDISGDFLNE